MTYKVHNIFPDCNCQFRSEEARMDALQAGIYPMDFVQRYFASFYCVACTLMGNRYMLFFGGLNSKI